MNYQELEIKILNIDQEKIKKKSEQNLKKVEYRKYTHMTVIAQF